MRVPFLLVALLVLQLPEALLGQDPADAPPDTYHDAGARALVQRARAARGRDVEGLESYEGVMRERIFVALTAMRFRRERGLFEQERIARLRWTADGDRVVQWLGARRSVPIIGADTRGADRPGDAGSGRPGAEARASLRAELPVELLGDAEPPAFAFDPGDDRLAFGDDWALHPLADTAETHYRYASGDTMRIRLPDRVVTLVELRVEPRRADVHLVAGSLWFDADTYSLVRASYRPARAFDLELDAAEEARDVPGLLKPITAEISYITVEYSLHEFRYWLPRRFALEGVARVGRLLSIPLTVEWSVRDYRVNQSSSDIPADGPLPPGWSRREMEVRSEGREPRYVTVIVPRADSVLNFPDFSEEFGARAPLAFSDAEIDELRGELESLLPTYRRFLPRLAWGLERGMIRYNRVEGLSVGSTVSLPLSPRAAVELTGRMGLADQEPNVEVTLLRGGEDRQWRLGGYHHLTSMDDWNDPFSLTSSLGGLILGADHGQYYRTTGVEAGGHRVGQKTRFSLVGFYERQRPVTLGTDFFLAAPISDDTVNTVLAADPGNVYGARGRLRWFLGLDPNGLILTGEVLGEAAWGDLRYRRAAVTLSASHPVPFGLAGAVELGAGALWGDEPLQRNFFLGGARTLRGLDTGDLYGVAFWRGRGELATGFAGARLGLFTDWGWAGPRASFGRGRALGSVGVGASLLDGLARLDVARLIRGGPRWNVHLYLDGLF